MKSRSAKPTKARKQFKKLKQLPGENAELSQVFMAACEAVFPILKKIDARDANSDLAVCVLQPMHKNGDLLTNKVLALRASTPDLEAFATAFAYPNHDYFDGAISLWPSAYPGKLLEKHVDRGPSVKLKPP